MARKVSAAVLAVEEFNIRLDKFTPLLDKMTSSMERIAVTTDKMLDLQIEQTESMRRRDEHERVKPKVKDDKGKETTVVPEKKDKEKKKGNSLNFIGGLGGIMGKIALGGLVSSFAALQMLDPIKKFVKDIITGFTSELWDNIKENLPGWIKRSLDLVSDKTKDKAGEVAGDAASNTAIGFGMGKLIKMFTRIPKLGRIGALAGGASSLMQEFGIDPTAAWATGGAGATALFARKQIAKLMPNALKNMLGTGWNVAKGTAGAVAGSAAKVAPPAAAAAGAGAAKGASWLSKKLPAVGKGAATVGRTIAPLLKWGPQTFIAAMTATDSRDGMQELTPEQRDYMDNTDRSTMENDIMKDWANSVAQTGVTPNLYTYHSELLKNENKYRDEPWTEQEIHERAMRLAQESLKLIPDAIVKPPKDIQPSPKPANPDEPMRLTIPPANTSEKEDDPRVYEESKSQTKRERRLAESSEKKASKPSVVALKGGDSHTKQGDNVNNVTNNYYSSVDPSKNLDPYRMGWA